MQLPRTICVSWPRLGPYHLARLRALHAYLNARGDRLVALETARLEALYAWRTEEAPEPFERVCVFPEGVFEEIPAERMYRGVMAALDRVDPAAVAITSYSTPDAWACLAWCRSRRRPAILMFDSRKEDTDRIRWREAIKRVLVQQYDAALVGGTPHKAYLRELGFPLAQVFTPVDVVDNAFFRAGAESARREPTLERSLPGLAEDGTYFLAVSRFVPCKNLIVLLQAYGSYRRRVAAPWRLVLVGDGAERAALEGYVTRHELRGVTFAGFQQVEALPAYYAFAGAFVHPTLKDTWGLVVNEAMAAGLPVLVSTGTGCAVDLVAEGQNGYTFDPTDPEGLAVTLARIASPDVDLGAFRRRSLEIISRYTPDDFAEGLCAAIEAGAERADRALTPGGGAFLAALRLLSRRSGTFHTSPT